MIHEEAFPNRVQLTQRCTHCASLLNDDIGLSDKHINEVSVSLSATTAYTLDDMNHIIQRYRIFRYEIIAFLYELFLD